MFLSHEFRPILPIPLRVYFMYLANFLWLAASGRSQDGSDAHSQNNRILNDIESPFSALFTTISPRELKIRRREYSKLKSSSDHWSKSHVFDTHSFGTDGEARVKGEHGFVHGWRVQGSHGQPHRPTTTAFNSGQGWDTLYKRSVGTTANGQQPMEWAGAVWRGGGSATSSHWHCVWSSRHRHEARDSLIGEESARGGEASDAAGDGGNEGWETRAMEADT